METECRFRTTQKILQSRAYGSVQTDKVELATLFMTVRCEIAQPRCETGTRSREGPTRT
jgi:hypothetical protein